MAAAQFTPEQIEFQEYARRWLVENRPPPSNFRLPMTPIEVATREQLDYLQDWQMKCYQAGLIGADCPKEYGGGGHTGFQRIANEEIDRVRVPYFVNIVGLNMAVPTILAHGTEEQKRKFIGPALSGEEIWCQGFSEPGAGSDMANQQTFAAKRGDEWVINGHKVWTSLGHFAKRMILIARTSKHHKYDGLSYFLCPIAGQAGVTIRPLVKMTGESGFNEVLFKDVVISDACRLDEEGKGWTVAMTTLTFERGASEGAGASGMSQGSPVTQLIELSKETYRDGERAADAPLTRDAIVQQAIAQAGIRQNERRAGVPALNDHPMRLPLQQKVAGSEFEQGVSRLGVELAGAHSTLYKLDAQAPDAGHWPLAYMNSYGHTISAGASEIQRNILGERVLGLPKTK